ncbi:hypothetical protein [uncultured Flavobacterium sp.]|uniref:hypothetical protein n=1 Tax=uncultured Flavobacterium sp. TaxID=165435 RepID=UPI0030EDD689|tara:strand:+ start:6213 stop:6761 length:549 start_codon:yes stop_codon:yes gene_type:complete
MKNYLLVFALVASAFTYSQNKITFSLGGDIRNCLVGSNPTENKPKADLLFKLTIQNDRMMEIGIGAEVFPHIDYTKVFVTVGRRINILNNFDIIGSVEPSIIDRTGTWGGESDGVDLYRSYVSAGASLTLRYKPFNNIFFEAQGNFTYREDLKARYNESKPLKPSLYFSIGIDLSKKIRRWK